MSRIYLSPPHLTGNELAHMEAALASNWVAPMGPDLDRFEAEVAARIGVPHALAVNTGTAALHLAVVTAGIGPGDEVLVPTLTVAATVNPILYVGATPTFIDSSPSTWMVDPHLVAATLEDRAARGQRPKALVLVHLYGQCADVEPIQAACDAHGVLLIEDAAEALGATYRGRPAGSFGCAAFFSFNGNKIITTSGGGMLLSDDGGMMTRARTLANQAREATRHYEHRSVGYNYRMSNVLAALGRAQFAMLDARVDARRAVFDWYVELLADVPGVAFMPEAAYGRSTRWLTTLTIDPATAGFTRDQVIDRLEAADVESRPVWKPMHRQPAFASFAAVGGEVADRLFDHGLCLPSGSSLTRSDVERIAGIVRACGARA